MIKFNKIKNKLKYKPIYKEINLNDGFEPIKILTNPSENIKNEIVKIILQNDNAQDIGNKDIFIPITKMLTKIQFENNQEEQEFMDFLFKEPSKEAENLRDNIIKVINETLTEIMKNMNTIFNNIDEKELQEIIKMSERERD